MPTIDVTDVLVSLGISAQEFSILRRQETVNVHGETVLQEVAMGPIIGAVQPLGERSLLREEAFSTQKNGITVWSNFRLNGVTRESNGVTYQPDLIYWLGDYYIVRGQDDWSDFGAGFTKVECIGYDYVQKATT